MSEEITLFQIEEKLLADEDGSYKAGLIEKLEKYRDDFATAKQGMLPPEEYDVVEGMLNSVEAAISLLQEVDMEGEGEEEAQGEDENTSLHSMVNV